VAAIPRRVERAFSKRRQAIDEAARVHGYNTPRGMELATLRTRRPKRDAAGRACQPLASRGQSAGVRAWPDGRAYAHHLQRTLSRGALCWAWPSPLAGQAGISINSHCSSRPKRPPECDPTRLPARPGLPSLGSASQNVWRQGQAPLLGIRAGLMKPCCTGSLRLSRWTTAMCAAD
jgi:hypothetical protein